MSSRKPVLTQKVVTDGIRVRTAWEFDTERATREDWRQLANVWNDGPKEWIEALEANLAGVKQVTPAIQLRIDAIRAILAGLPTSPVNLNREQMQQLTDALQHWTEIMVLRDVMPKARQAKKRAKQLTEFAVKGNKARKKYSDADKARWRAMAESDASLIRLRKTSVRKCAEAIARREGLPEGAAETIRRAI
ncbi:hypothetical protein WDL1CHR_00879 [Variovorax sp. WDL1]|nr:hypothetical protein CHC07_02747 [Variovorax sp. B4]PNG57756.1 hypothetical protein CHC06_02750 [Variovorax sp. B2]VTV09811.1 hypothetical protein WDL1CHR_00879 [Variovorax sp. WDL1]